MLGSHVVLWLALLQAWRSLNADAVAIRRRQLCVCGSRYAQGHTGGTHTRKRHQRVEVRHRRRLQRAHSVRSCEWHLAVLTHQHVQHADLAALRPEALRCLHGSGNIRDVGVPRLGYICRQKSKDPRRLCDGLQLRRSSARGFGQKVAAFIYGAGWRREQMPRREGCDRRLHGVHPPTRKLFVSDRSAEQCAP